MNQTLRDLCGQAMEIGRALDLRGCEYGLHTRTRTWVGQPEYYNFLAGFARRIAALQVLEIGTHYGGSAKALAEGMPGHCGKLVTVDIKKKHTLPAWGAQIVPLQGNAENPLCALEIRGLLQAPIDLLFIDSTHSREHVARCVRLYAGKLDPRFVILDDIRLNEGMVSIWAELSSVFPSFDASDLCGRSCGFGVIAWSGV